MSSMVASGSRLRQRAGCGDDAGDAALGVGAAGSGRRGSVMRITLARMGMYGLCVGRKSYMKHTSYVREDAMTTADADTVRDRIRRAGASWASSAWPS